MNKPLLTLSLSEYVAETKQSYLEAFQDGRIVIPEQTTRDWLVKSFAGIERYAEGLNAAFETIQALSHGVSSWRLPALFAQVQQALDELPERP